MWVILIIQPCFPRARGTTTVITAASMATPRIRVTLSVGVWRAQRVNTTTFIRMAALNVQWGSSLLAQPKLHVICALQEHFRIRMGAHFVKTAHQGSIILLLLNLRASAVQ